MITGKAGVLLLLAASYSSALFGGTFIAFGPETYVRGTGEPVSITKTFSVADPNAGYLIDIENAASAAFVALVEDEPA